MRRLRLSRPTRWWLAGAVVVGLTLPLVDPGQVVGADNVAPLPSAAPRALVVPFIDDFTGPAGSAPDSTHWQFQLGGGGWGNQELETYTSSTSNAALDGHGDLVISARRTGAAGHYTYTSARLASVLAVGPHLHAEARIKLAPGYGVWPTFWLMGGDAHGITWPITGEVDIAENVGRLPNTLIATAHGANPDRPPPFHWQSDTWIKTRHPLPARWHVYAVDVTSNSIVWSLDGHPYKVLHSDNLPDAGDLWSFNTPFHVILDVAVGGWFAHAPKSTTRFPSSMLVDYVKVETTP